MKMNETHYLFCSWKMNHSHERERQHRLKKGMNKIREKENYSGVLAFSLSPPIILSF